MGMEKHMALMEVTAQQDERHCIARRFTGGAVFGGLAESGTHTNIIAVELGIEVPVRE